MKPRGNANRADMPQFLAALDKTVGLLSRLQSGTPLQEDVSEAITTHIETLDILVEMTRGRLMLMVTTRANGEAITDFIQKLLGRDSSVAHHARQMTESVPQIEKRDIDVLEALGSQVARLERLRRELPLEKDLAGLVSREVEILRELPRLFPEEAPVRLTLEKRTALLS